MLEPSCLPGGNEEFGAASAQMVCQHKPMHLYTNGHSSQKKKSTDTCYNMDKA